MRRISLPPCFLFCFFFSLDLPHSLLLLPPPPDLICQRRTWFDGLQGTERNAKDASAAATEYNSDSCLSKQSLPRCLRRNAQKLFPPLGIAEIIDSRRIISNYLSWWRRGKRVACESIRVKSRKNLSGTVWVAAARVFGDPK